MKKNWQQTVEETKLWLPSARCPISCTQSLLPIFAIFFATPADKFAQMSQEQAEFDHDTDVGDSDAGHEIHVHRDKD